MLTYSKRTVIRFVSFFTALVLTGFGFSLKSEMRTQWLMTQTEYAYSRNLEDLSACLANIAASLDKAQYADSATEWGTLAAELWKEAGTAKSALAQLPQSESELTKVNRLLSQVGDYSLFLAKQLIAGTPLTGEQRENLAAMSKMAGELAEKLGDFMAFYNDGYWASEVLARWNNATTADFGKSMENIEELITDYPELIYDGPYSDHLLTATPKLNEYASAITAEEAKKSAAAVLQVNPGDLTAAEEENGRLACYRFETDGASADITVMGGYVADFRRYRTVGDETISPEQAVEKAQAYLDSGEASFAPTYYFCDEGMCTVNFALTDGDLLLYPDLVKIGVALDNGELLMVEASTYLSNHTERDLPAPSHTEQEAQAVLSRALEVTSARLAVIPTSGGSEKLCYEFHCRGNNDEEILAYINTETLQEENLLLLLKTDGGTFVK